MRRPSKSRKKSILGTIFYVFFLCFALLVGSIYGWATRSSLLSGMIRHPLDFLNSDPRAAFGGKGSETLLILGCDEDRFYHGVLLHGHNVYKKYARSDMMLVAKLDFDHDTITGLSIPRDTMCQLPGYGRHKINAFHELAKPEVADSVSKAAVESILPGVKIDKVVDLDFEAIQRLVDVVGGVKVDVPKQMDYDDNAGFLHIHLKPGVQVLNGYNAMCFVRFRHDRESDFGRQQRQKDFLTAFKSSVFQNPFKLPEIAEQGKACLNYALNDDELRGLAAFSRKVPTQNIKMGMVPVVDGPRSYLLVDKRNLTKTLAEYGFSEHGADTTPKSE